MCLVTTLTSSSPPPPTRFINLRQQPACTEHLIVSLPPLPQFIVFFVCSQHAPGDCAASFVELLLGRLLDARQPAITRSACAAYLASFLARAAFIPQAQVRQLGSPPVPMPSTWTPLPAPPLSGQLPGTCILHPASPGQAAGVRPLPTPPHLIPYAVPSPHSRW